MDNDMIKAISKAAAPTSAVVTVDKICWLLNVLRSTGEGNEYEYYNLLVDCSRHDEDNTIDGMVYQDADGGYVYEQDKSVRYAYSSDPADNMYWDAAAKKWGLFDYDALEERRDELLQALEDSIGDVRDMAKAANEWDEFRYEIEAMNVDIGTLDEYAPRNTWCVHTAADAQLDEDWSSTSELLYVAPDGSHVIYDKMDGEYSYRIGPYYDWKKDKSDGLWYKVDEDEDE